MTVEQDLERAVRAWVAHGSERLPDPALDAALREISITPQRRAGWLARRFPIVNSNRLRFGVAAVAIIAAGVIGLSFLPGNIGGPAPTPTPTPLQSPVTIASGSFTAPLLASGVTTVDIDAIGSGARASGSMEVSDADGRFSVDLQCTRWTMFYTLLVGGEVTDSTHDAAAEGSRVVIAFHPRTVITALMWFEDSPRAPTCEAFLERIRIPIDVANAMKTVDGVMRFESYAANCDGRGCAEIDSPRATPFQSLASGSFTAPLLASGVTTVDIDAFGIEPRLEGSESRSATPALGFMEVSDADGRFSVDVQCTRWTGDLLIGGVVTDSTHDAAAEGGRVLIAFHPRSVIEAALRFENSPTAPTCGVFLESISIPIGKEPVIGVMSVGLYAADCDRGCTEIDATRPSATAE